MRQARELVCGLWCVLACALGLGGAPCRHLGLLQQRMGCDGGCRFGLNSCCPLRAPHAFLGLLSQIKCSLSSPTAHALGNRGHRRNLNPLVPASFPAASILPSTLIPNILSNTAM